MKNTNLNNEQVTNPLLNPLNHSIEDSLKEIQFGRPAETQLLIQSWIDELPQQKLLGKTISKEVADKDSFEDVTKYKIEKGYSEEEVLEFTQTIIQQYKFGNTNIEQLDLLKETLEQFKNK